MTAEDFSNTFDIMFNNLMSDRAPEVNDYEKSVLLTLAQEAVAAEVLSSAFEADERRRRAVDALVEGADVAPSGEAAPAHLLHAGVETALFDLPARLWAIVRETAVVSSPGSCLDGLRIPVRPERHDDLSHDIGNPFRDPSARRALRVDVGGTRAARRVALLSGLPLSSYGLAYARRPRPILLADFSGADYDQVHIRGVSTFKGALDGYDPSDLMAEPCELGEAVHAEIVARAAQMARAALAS